MKLSHTSLPDVLLFTPRVFGDHRGFFMETWREDVFAQAGITARFVQENHSKSGRGILRGLHYQRQQAQGKFIRVVAGEIFDVAVDLRRHSITFGQWVGVTLSADNKLGLWVPPGFAHGFYVTGDGAEVSYKCTAYYAPEHEHSLLWNDPALGIEWPIAPGEAPILSDKDRKASPLAEAPCYD
ncbi:MAG: dTDP-4-dehydrorhamnose 3,5-epimerase [Pseudomonadales bacterium]|nr:dTDP-4-dehydrorhamnose 3,5-epimerase [Pseudomonadales bacterium]